MHEIKYRKPEEMKDSGIEWLGKIPKEWNTTKLKFIVNQFITGGTPSSSNSNYYVDFNEGIPWVSISDMSTTDKITRTKTSITKQAIKSKNLRILEKGTLIYSIFATLGKVSELKIDATTNQAILGLIHNEDKVYKVFLKYWLKNFEVNMKYYSSSNTQENLNLTKVKNIKFLEPTDILEQQKIANFLDIKTAEFDSIIEKKEKLIDKLEEAKKSLISEVVTGKVKLVDGQLIKRKPEEMKDSGVEWLGMMPKDWEVKRIKHLSKIISKGTTPSTVGKEIIDKGEVKFLKAENIFNNKINEFPEYYIDKKTNRILKRSELKENDILFVIAGATIGKVAIVDKTVIPANINQAISFIRLTDEENSKYIYYWFRSSQVQNHMWSFAVQAAQPNLSMHNLGNFYIPYPNVEERSKIIEMLDKIDQNFEKAMSKIQFQIQKLKEAKHSLISEAVTGKIDLRDWEIIEQGE